MALPDTVARFQGQIAMHGIRFTMAPLVTVTDAHLYDVEIQRAPDSAGSPDTGNAETIQRIAPIARNGTPYTDYLPNDGVRRHYRWRHVRSGYAAGAWSAWLRTPPSTGTYGAKPVALPIVTPNPDVSQFVGEVVFSAASPPSVGGPAGASTLTKTVKVPYTSFRAEYGSTIRETFALAAIWADAAATNTYATSALYLPPGATVIGLEAYTYRATTSDAVACALYRIEDDATSHTLASVSRSGAGTTGWESGTGSCSDVVGTDQYLLRVFMNGSGAREDAKFRRAMITYTIPNLGVGL